MATSKTKYVTTKYGTKINVTGLTPEQTKKVLSTAQDNGAYGAKGATLADTFRKQAAKTPAVPAPVKPPQDASILGSGNTAIPGAVNPDAGINQKTGVIDPSSAFNAAPKLNFDVQGDANKARDAAYNYISKDYGQQKTQEMEAAKQELAQRGIPLDPSPNSLYGRTLQQIDQKYQSMNDQAQNQAFAAGNQTFGTESGAATNAYQAFMSSVQGIAGIDMQKYQTDKNYKAQMDQIATQKYIAQLNKRPSGGGGSTESDPSFGGAAP